MKTFLLLFITLCLFQNTYSQTNRILVDYDFVFAGEFLDKEMKKQAFMVDLMKGFEEAIMKTKFKLTAQNNISIFKAVATMPLDKETSGQEMAKLMNNATSVYYRNTTEKVFIEEEDFGSKRYSVNKDYESVKWELTTESKTVTNFLCYKAIGIDPDRKPPVFAWFCPEIPIGTGPIEYGNLPGLILELTIGKMTYIASKIDFDSTSNLKIELPTKNLISEAEFSKIVKVSSSRIIGE